MQAAINSATGKVHVQDLQCVHKDGTALMKAGEEEKTKNYLALCRCEEPITDEQISRLNFTSELVLKQKTPIRVLHRLSLAVRSVYQMSARRVDSYVFTLSLTTQAGTYVKELVHGDFNRTQPNVTQLLGAPADIIALDVTEVCLDWPPRL